MIAPQNNVINSIVIANGSAAVIDTFGKIISNQDGILDDNKVIIPRRYIDLRQMRDIYINSGIIRFEDNNALLNFVVQESIVRTIMPQLGKVAEAIIVKRCNESEDVKYQLFCIATGKRARKETARQFVACGTSLIETKVRHLRHYSPHDTQRDVVFVNSSDKVAFMSNATSVAGECAGLQIKTSNDIVNYIIHDIINGRYCVPIICFPLMAFPNSILQYRRFEEKVVDVNIYDVLLHKILGNKTYVDKLIEKRHDFFYGYLNTAKSFENRLYDLLVEIIFDIRDIDAVAFDELIIAKEILEHLVRGRISPDDLLRESEVLKSSLMSLGLFLVSPSVESNNSYVPVF